MVLCIVLNVSALKAQDTDNSGRWYFGASGGATLGQCTFRSVTTEKSNIGGAVGVFGGYGFNSVFALEGSAGVGSMKLTAQTCDPFWLSADGINYFAPVIDQSGDFYKNLTAKTQTAKLALQLNIDLIKIFTEPCNRFSLTIAPQISLVSTKNKLTSDNFKQKYDRQNHFGCGAQAAAGFFVSKNIDIQIFGGVTGLSGDRFDNIPKHHHESNLIWDGGIKVAYHFGRTCGEKPAEPYTDIKPAPDTTTNIQVVDIPTVDTTQTQPVVVVDNNNNDTPTPDITDDSKSQEPDRQDIEPQKSTTVLPTIYFADNGVSISQKEYPKFREIANYLKDNPQAKISIYGYCSKVGTVEYNQYLSQRRADLIKRRLMQSGVSDSRFVNVVGKGVDHAAPDNKTARRVEIIIEN